jgi:Glycosyltransferase family 87
MRSLLVTNDPQMSAEAPAMNTSTASPYRHAYSAVALLAIVASLGLAKNIDFGVYWHAVRSFNNQSQPLYGPGSGIGYPMIFRYPPIAYLLLWPLGSLPLRWAGFVWILGAWTLAIVSVLTTARVLHLQFRPPAVLLSFAGILAYCVLAVHSGNIQPYLIAMIFSALTLSRRRPVLAAGLLAISISFKIWPVFFLPCFLRPGRRAVLTWLFPALLILWLIPLVVWPPHQYVHLIGQWYREELQIGSAPSELWYFPGQSLRGILLRYTTSADPWLHGFPDVHFVCLSTAAAVRIWFVAASCTYVAVCSVMLRSAARTQWVWDGLFFALFCVLEPFCPKSSMIALGPAVMVGAALYSEITAGGSVRAAWIARRLFVLACVLSFLCAVMQYRPALRLMLAIGADFYVSLLLLLALALWIAGMKALRSTSLPQRKTSEGAG